MSAEPLVIGVSGQIASGKSTLVANLAPLIAVTPLPEPDAANPYLGRFYREPKRWALHNLLYFFERSMQEQATCREQRVSILQERLPQEHIEVFGREFHACGFLGDDDMALADRLVALVAGVLVAPDLVVYLEVDPQEAFRRLRGRGHTGDDRVTLPYLCGLASRYEAFIDGWQACPVLRVDTAAVDVRDPDDIRPIAEALLSRLPGERSKLVARSAAPRSR